MISHNKDLQNVYSPLGRVPRRTAKVDRTGKIRISQPTQKYLGIYLEVVVVKIITFYL
jgi:hypothetical protein